MDAVIYYPLIDNGLVFSRFNNSGIGELKLDVSDECVIELERVLINDNAIMLTCASSARVWRNH